MFNFKTRFFSSMSNGLALAFVAACSMTQAYGGGNMGLYPETSSRAPAACVQDVLAGQPNERIMKIAYTYIWEESRDSRDRPYEPMCPVYESLNSFYDPSIADSPEHNALIGFLEKRFQAFSSRLSLDIAKILEDTDPAHKKQEFSQLTSALAVLEGPIGMEGYIVDHILRSCRDPRRSLELIAAVPHIKSIYEDVLRNDYWANEEDQEPNGDADLNKIIKYTTEIPPYEVEDRLRFVAAKVKRLFDTGVEMDSEYYESRLNLVRNILLLPTNEILSRLKTVSDWKYLLVTPRMRGHHRISTLISAMALPLVEIEDRIRTVHRLIIPLLTESMNGLEQSRIIQNALRLTIDELEKRVNSTNYELSALFPEDEVAL